jgi:glucose/arabinose dehydrogenase
LSSIVVAVAVPALCASTTGADATAIPRHATVKPLALPAILPVATGYTTQDYFATGGASGMGFDQSLSTAFVPGEKDRLFVVSKTGVIDVITNLEGKGGPPRRSTFMDLNPYLKSKNLELGQEKEWGLLCLTFHPKFKENGYFYITYDFIDTENGQQLVFDRLARFSVSNTDPNQADMGSELPLITQLDNTPNHNGGCIAFNENDGYLYYGMGDDGYPRDDEDNARWVDRNFFAALYRIDVDCKPENLEPNAHAQASVRFPSAVEKDATGKANYRVPADNPLIGIRNYLGKAVDPGKVRTEIFSHGLRNPWRFAFDPVTGRLFLSDVGEDWYEEVNIITKGGHYGWPYREGPEEGPRSDTAPANVRFVEPAFFYPHGQGNICITGGFVYRGSRMPELNGAYIYADYLSGRVSAIRETEGKWGPAQVLAESIRGIVNIGPDPVDGDILLTTIGPGAGMNVPPAPSANGHVLRLVRSGMKGASPPALLSQVGAFKSLQTLEPVEGVVAYEPNVTFWSDYAVKQRWFIISDAKDTIAFDPSGNWKFPTGMVWVKHFEMEMTRGDASTRKRLETRFLVKTAENVYGITYKWRADNSDADLVPETGQDEVLTIHDQGVVKQQKWHYPSQGECLQCHTTQAGGALAFNTWQLNGNGRGGSNQIEQLAQAGYFSAGSAIPPAHTLGAYAKADDASASLEWRVRSYLGANCVQCHQPGGPAQGTWDARPSTPFAAAGILNGALNNSRGDAANKVIAPGDLAHSMIFKRLEARDAPRMPPLATNELDPSARTLLREWISTLKR